MFNVTMYRQDHLKTVLNNIIILRFTLHQLNINSNIFHVIDNCANIFYIKYLNKAITSRHLGQSPLYIAYHTKPQP